MSTNNIVVGGSGGSSVKQQAIHISIPDGRTIRIPVGSFSYLYVYPTQPATATLIARVKMGQVGDSVSNKYDAPVWGGVEGPVRFPIPQGVSFAFIVPDSAQSPSAASPIVLDLVLSMV